MQTYIYDHHFTAGCYFRSTSTLPNRKIILQITEKCNLHCKHCFLSSTNAGHSLTMDQFTRIIHVLKKGNVTKVTLTGGEPFCNPWILQMINDLTKNNIHVSICTNATMVTQDIIERILDKNMVHFNTSLDGFSADSHGIFRGNSNPLFFEKLLKNISMIAQYNMLNGILSTPNKYASINEYIMLCKFAYSIKARYVLFNPLSEFGRGQDSVSLGYSSQQMAELKEATQIYNSNEFEVVYIRFRNKDHIISPCPLGSIPYVFTNGDVAICPYLVFAANDTVSKYKPELFIIGNVYEESFDLEDRIIKYKLPTSTFAHPPFCNFDNCSGGCYAAKISKGEKLDACDRELCPMEGT